nr:cation diffusion facilitator family transporter [Adlercreutzia sp. JBNU-10]
MWIVFVLNLAVAAAKYFYGLASGSASMQADGIHSVFDSVGNIVGLVSIALAARPADAGHPYGHSKFETYGSLVIGVLLLAAAFEVGSGAVEKLATGTYTAVVTPASFAVMVGTLAVNLGVTTYERRAGRRLKSEIIMADAAHTLSDVFVSLGVIAGLALVALGFPQADPVMALVVTVAILFSAWGVFRAAFRTLSDTAQLPEADVRAVASAVEGIRGVHRVRTRGTEAEVYCDLHIWVDPAMSVRDAHALGDAVEAAVKGRFPAVKEVLVHIEPEGDAGDDEGGPAGE